MPDDPVRRSPLASQVRCYSATNQVALQANEGIECDMRRSLGRLTRVFTSCLGAQQTICDCINISAIIRYLGLCACIGWWLLFQQTPDENPDKRRWNSHHNFPRRANVQIVMTAKWVFQWSQTLQLGPGQKPHGSPKGVLKRGTYGPLRWLVRPGLFSATNCWPVLFVCWIDR